MDKLKSVTAFRRVAELGSFSAAARDLGLSNAVISKYITQLEDHLRAKLLTRTTRHVALTDAGATYLERIRGILDDLAEADDAVSGLQSRPTGTIRVNAPMSFGLLHIAPALSGFLDAYPELEVDLSFDDSVVDPIRAAAEVTFRVRSEMPDSSLIARRLAPVRRVLCAAPGYLERAEPPEKPADLARHDCLVYSNADRPQVWPIGNENVAIHGRVRADNSLALREVLLAGKGVALVPTFIVGPDLKSGALRVVLSEHEPGGHDLYAVFPPGRRISRKAQLFVEHVRDWIGQPPYWDREIPA